MVHEQTETKKAQPEVHQLLRRHGENYKRKFGEEIMLNWGRDGRLAKVQLKLRGLVRCLELNDQFFQMNGERDGWHTRDFTFPAFNTAVPELVKRHPAKQEAKYGHLTER